ncbi:MAG: hypothetical protein KAJ29_01365 [Alphaproteobacteria bacterium]|nr:hypothetical protein [Alphaproteobacteria bacterium]
MGLDPKRNPSKQSGSGFFLIAGLVLCLFLALGIGLYLHQINVQQATVIAQQEQESAKLETQKEKEREKRKIEIQALFDTYLNAFKSELVHKASIYKKTRKLLKNLIRPNNFRTPEFAKENYALFKESLAPSLREKSTEMIAIFERYSSQIEKELDDDEDDLQTLFLDQWRDMAKEQLDTYVDFFAREEEMILAYDELVTFYYTRSKRYIVDEEKNKFIFSTPEDKVKAQSLLERALELQKPEQETE